MSMGEVQLRNRIIKSIKTLFPRLAALAVGAALTAAVAATACLDAPDSNGQKTHGVSDDQILFGQSAAFRGPAQELGREMRLGIQAAFHEVNQSGGVHGRELHLKTIDDAYQPDLAFHTTKWLIEKVGVFALVGPVGTPTTRVAAPVAHEAGVPIVAPFTGAEFLRDPALNNVLNLRASYHQETEAMVARLTEDLGVTQVAVFYQDDSFGKNGLEGVRLALHRRGLQPVGASSYQRSTGGGRRALSQIVEANPEAVIMIGTQEAVATAIKSVRLESDPLFMTISFGGGQALAKTLGEAGDGVYVTQVVPFPEDASIPVVARYQTALSHFDPNARPGFVSLEGYLAGQLAIFGLEACGRQLSRQCFIDALFTASVIDIDGFLLEFGPNDNQGSDTVFLTVIGKDETYRQVDKLGNWSRHHR